MSDRAPTAAESLFLDELWQRFDGVDVRFGRDATGAPRLILSYPLTDGPRAGTHLAVTYDGRRLRGGWRAAAPDWAEGPGVDGPPDAGRDGLRLDRVEPAPAATAAAEWLIRQTGRPVPALPRVPRAAVTLLVLLLAAAVLLVLLCFGPLLLYRLLFPDGPFA